MKKTRLPNAEYTARQVDDQRTSRRVFRGVPRCLPRRTAHPRALPDIDRMPHEIAARIRAALRRAGKCPCHVVAALAIGILILGIPANAPRRAVPSETIPPQDVFGPIHWYVPHETDHFPA